MDEEQMQPVRAIRLSKILLLMYLRFIGEAKNVVGISPFS